MTGQQVKDQIEAAVKRAGSARALAAEWKMSMQYLSDVRAGKRSPGPKILAGLGLQMQRQYARRTA